MKTYFPFQRWLVATRLALAISIIAMFGGLPMSAHAAALSFDEAIVLSTRNTPQFIAAQSKLEAARQAEIPAGELPDPKLALGIENFPVSGRDRYRLTQDFMTMQRIAVMQEIPNRDKRRARIEAAEARIRSSESEQQAAALNLQKETAIAWIQRYSVEQQLVQLDELLAENQRFDAAVRAQLAANRAASTDVILPRQEAAMLEERRDELIAQRTQAMAALERWIGDAAARPLQGTPRQWLLQKEELLGDLYRHPELQTTDAMVNVLDAEVREAQAQKKSDWGIELAYQRRGEQFGDMVSMAVTFDLPWFSARRQNPEIAAKLAERDSLDAEREALRQEHVQVLIDDWAELERIERALERNRDTFQNLAQEKIELALAAYQNSQGSLAEVIAARRESLELKFKQIVLEGERDTLAARLHYASEDDANTGAKP